MLDILKCLLLGADSLASLLELLLQSLLALLVLPVDMDLLLETGDELGNTAVFGGDLILGPLRLFGGSLQLTGDGGSGVGDKSLRLTPDSSLWVLILSRRDNDGALKRFLRGRSCVG